MTELSARVSIDLESMASTSGELIVYSPALALFPKEIAQEAAFLPLCNPNQVVMERLRNGAGLAPENCFCGIFTLDPLLNWAQLEPILRNANFRGLCNFPTLPDFGEEERNALVASDYSYDSEIARLADLAGDTFELLVVYSDDCQFDRAKAQLSASSTTFCKLGAIQYMRLEGATAVGQLGDSVSPFRSLL
ncbi:MAG: phosphoenolpyruvate hydrolase family protein [Boseongicola sp. SB0677_bin_26]|nr:phosphoenolpyruvate hydrolase family protein [Boseongicola sp. SB0665_bin_10]MYG28355.1 phosphoenolpyruvate hydrolase family protein [Boseongicola sp. SB0677_bin_26]